MRFDFHRHAVVGTDEETDKVNPALTHTAPRTAEQYRLMAGPATPTFELDPGEGGRRYVTDEAIAEWDTEYQAAQRQAHETRLTFGPA